MIDDKVIKWYRKSRYKFIWDYNTIKDYIEALMATVNDIIEIIYGDKITNKYTSEEIGVFIIKDENGDTNNIWGCALYIMNKKLWKGDKTTAYSQFKKHYSIQVFSFREFPFSSLGTDEFIKSNFPDRAQYLLQKKRRCKKLVKTFKSIANKSLNHRRKISSQLRYAVLVRDNSTCQLCGRRPPEVKVQIDHIKPVSWDLNWVPSNDPSDYQVLCEECNYGKGNLSWLISI